ncbi:protein of unknown function [Micropruina glycogenica]|uniref:Uncharacterized protein n=1 Tax=Micropruina glycogenica TaxID=75385 RepID=A0A2N9JLA7_9ACTN|nr:protein of unknown function [Micropruina glycogenica]
MPTSGCITCPIDGVRRAHVPRRHLTVADPMSPLRWTIELAPANDSGVIST